MAIGKAAHAWLPLSRCWTSVVPMRIRFSIEFAVEDENPELEKSGKELIRVEVDAFVEDLRRRLTDAGIPVRSFSAEYR